MTDGKWLHVAVSYAIGLHCYQFHVSFNDEETDLSVFVKSCDCGEEIHMNSGVSIFCILLLIYLIVAAISLILGYDITNDRLIVFISLAAMVSSLIDLLNVCKSKVQNELMVIKKVYRIKDKINKMKDDLERKYDYGSNLFEDYIDQVFNDSEKEKIYQNRLLEEDKKLYCEKISSYKFDDTKLKDKIKEFVNIEISNEVKMLAEEEDYTLIDGIVDTLQIDINRWQKIINIVTSICVFSTLIVMIYFDNLIGLFPKLDLNVSIFSFVIIICSIIIREYQNYELEDIKNTIDEILEEIREEDRQ